VRCRPRSLNTMKWSRHSLRIEPMRKTVSDLLDVLDEWSFGRILCPACGEEMVEKLAIYTANQFESRSRRGLRDLPLLHQDSGPHQEWPRCTRRRRTGHDSTQPLGSRAPIRKVAGKLARTLALLRHQARLPESLAETPQFGTRSHAIEPTFTVRISSARPGAVVQRFTAREPMAFYP
jgi:hypothetical protein